MSTLALSASSSPARLSVPMISNVFVKMRYSRPKPLQITCSSGTGPATCSSLAAPDVVSLIRIPLVREDQFLCLDAVDLPRLLKVTRATLFEIAESVGASVLIDEHWSVRITSSKYRNCNAYRVHIRYSASAARSERCDIRQPIALDKAQGIPGLMTILERIE